MEINNFRGKYAFLSNFYPSEITYLNKPYPTVEHAYQAAKCANPHDREAIRLAKTPGAAKAFGQKVLLRENWDAHKVQYMSLFLYRKFRKFGLKRELLATGDAELIEGNAWGDTFWGVCDGKGENMLGKLLMELREEFAEDA